MKKMASELIDKPAIGGGKFRDFFRSRAARNLDAYVDDNANSSSGESEDGENDYLTKKEDGQDGEGYEGEEYEGEENEEDAIGAELDGFGGPPRGATFGFTPPHELLSLTKEINRFVKAIGKQRRAGFLDEDTRETKFTYDFESLNLGVQAFVKPDGRFWLIEELYITGDMDISTLVSHPGRVFKVVVEAEPTSPDWQALLYAALQVIMVLQVHIEGVNPRALPQVALKMPAANLGDMKDDLRLVPTFRQYIKTIFFVPPGSSDRKPMFDVIMLSADEFQFRSLEGGVGGGGSASPSVLRVAATACFVTLACIFAPTWVAM